MPPDMRKWFDLPRLLNNYKRRTPLVLVNGLAEQPESWFANRNHFSRHFDVKIPEILVYDGDALHRQIDSGGEVTVDYLADRLAVYLDEFVQRPPYHLVGSSLGCQVILTYATRYPERVSRIVLICPSGFHGDENLPGDGRGQAQPVRHAGQVGLSQGSVRHRRSRQGIRAEVPGSQVEEGRAPDAARNRGPFRRRPAPAGAPSHAGDLGCERSGALRRAGAIRAADQILKVRQVVIPKCGHAPQIEKARLVNQLVVRYLKDKLKTVPPALDQERFLSWPDGQSEVAIRRLAVAADPR